MTSKTIDLNREEDRVFLNAVKPKYYKEYGKTHIFRASLYRSTSLEFQEKGQDDIKIRTFKWNINQNGMIKYGSYCNLESCSQIRKFSNVHIKSRYLLDYGYPYSTMHAFATAL